MIKKITEGPLKSNNLEEKLYSNGKKSNICMWDLTYIRYLILRLSCAIVNTNGPKSISMATNEAYHSIIKRSTKVYWNITCNI